MKTKKRLASLLLAASMTLPMIPAAYALDSVMSTEYSVDSGIETVQFEVSYDQAEARKMLPMINDLRTGDNAWAWNKTNTQKIYYDLEPLEYDYELEKVAMKRAAEIALAMFSDHTSPNGRNLENDLLYDDNYYFLVSRECINSGSNTASRSFEMFLEANKLYSGQGHRRTMLMDSPVKTVAVGCASYNDYHYWVICFGHEKTNTPETTISKVPTTVDIDVLVSNIQSSTVTLSQKSLSVPIGSIISIPSLNASLLMKGDVEPSLSSNGEKTVKVNPTWKISDERYAKIVDGKVQGIKAGTTTLTTTTLGKTVSIPVTVTAPCVHKYSNTVTKAPTCDKQGEMTYTCTKCGNSYTTPIPALGGEHVYKNGICEKCGAGEPNCPIDNFEDIEKGLWYHDGVHYVLEKGLMSGTNKSEFSPNIPLTRAMVAQILYARAGSPKVTEASPFTDVDDSQWYAKAVTWAAGKGVVSGLGDGLFGSNNNVTREQLAIMLYSSAGKPEVSGELNFADASSVSSWAADAMLWATQNGIISGTAVDNTTLLNPTGQATRAQAAAMFMQFDKKVK